MTIPTTNASSTALQQVSSAKTDATTDKRSSCRTRQSPNYYSFGLFNHRPTKRPHRAGEAKNFQPQNISVIETVQSTAEQVPEETKISSVIGNESLRDLRLRSLAKYRSPTPKKDTNSLTVYEVEMNTNLE